MKMTLVEVEQPGGVVSVSICESCMEGKHMTYGHDHSMGPVGRRTCKNISDDRQRQCCCDSDWPELQKAILLQRKKA